VRSGGASTALWNALTAPGTLLLGLVFVVPVGLLVVYSFGTPDVLGRPTLELGATFRNYATVFTDYNLPVLVRTFGYALSATLICIVLGYSVAYAAARFAGKYGLLVVGLVLLPWLVNYLVRIYGWRTITADNGLLNSALEGVGLGPVTLLGTPLMVVIGLVYGYLPLMILPIYSSLGQLNPEIIDAGKDLYGGPFSTFWHVTLPSTKEGIVGGVMLVFLPTLGDFATAQFLGGPNTTMVGNIIADQFMSAGSQPFGAALTTILVVGLILAVLFSRAAGRRRRLGSTL
jgi:spermidine/putrescine transport system permease protein